MLATGTDFLYGTWIPRSLKYAPPGVSKVVSFGQQLTVRWLIDEFNENFFKQPKSRATEFGKDMSLHLGSTYDASHFEALHDLGYLPILIKALPEGLETPAGIPHMTFINTVKGFAWLTLYLETIISSLAWKPATSATIAMQYKRNATDWVADTDPKNDWLVPFLCHDFSARGLSPWDSLSSGLGHATSFRGSDSLIVIPGARYFYDESHTEVCINSVNASEHSVSTTKIFTVGEKQMIIDWLKEFPSGILSVVCDTFSTWQFVDYLRDPEIKELIENRAGKLVVRPDSGDPVEIICGKFEVVQKMSGKVLSPIDSTKPEDRGVIQLLYDIFGGIVNEQGRIVLNPKIGAIYGDSINLERQAEIYQRLSRRGFATSNIVLGVGSFTYQMNTRDTLGWAAKGGWFEANGVGYGIYKDPVTGDGSKKSPKGLLQVINSSGRCAASSCLYDGSDIITMTDQCNKAQEEYGLLQPILIDGKFHNATTLTEIRRRLLGQV